MDHVNRFETTTTYRLLRAEYAVALLVCVVLFVRHLHEVHWLPALVLFTYIDVVGYLPGAVAHHRAAKAGRPGPQTSIAPRRPAVIRIPRRYYVLYNTMHSLVTQAVVAGLWVLLAGPEWALLALPIHLCGDRALFGNFLKPFGVPFEPAPTAAFEEFLRALGDPAGQRRRSPVLTGSR